MLHEGNEGPAIRLQRGRGVRRQRTDAAPVAGDHAGEAGVIGLHPARRVGRAVVLPGGKPQQHQAHVVFTRLLQQRIDEGEIELAFLRLDLLPGDRHLHRIGTDDLHRRPHCLQRCGVVAGVVDLRAQHQEGLAIHQQRMPAILAGELWDRRLPGVIGRRRFACRGRLCSRGAIGRCRRRFLLTGGQQTEQGGRQQQAAREQRKRVCGRRHARGPCGHQVSLRNGDAGSCCELIRLASAGFSRQA